MIRISLVVLLVLLALPSLAQDVDYSVAIQADERVARLFTTYIVRASRTVSETPQGFELEVDLPGQVLRIFPHDQATNCTDGHPIRCTAPASSDLNTGFAATVSFPAAGTYTATARVTSSTPDPHPENNTATHTIAVAGLPSLRAYARANLPEGDVVDPLGAGALRIGIQNDGEAATNVVLRARFPEGGTFTGSADGRCTLTPAEVTCRLGNVPFFGVTQISFPFVAPDRTDGGTFPFIVTVQADEEDFKTTDDEARGEILLRRLFAVTSAGDEGAGSLRQAMLDARVFCETAPCLIGVRTAEPIVIQPRTALPELRGRMKLDGGGKTTLDGSLLAAGDALQYDDGCEFGVNGFAIRGFKGHAIEAHLNPDCGFGLLTGVSITNNELAGNRRGVVTKGMSGTISDNVIRDHTRAGIFADGTYFMEISRNEIIDNGASGIFINATRGGLLPPGGQIVDNVIRGNGEWGIARPPNGSIEIFRNSISGNNLPGIDVGLDLDTSPRATHEPLLYSAVFDPSLDATVIRGNLEPVATGHSAPSVQLYASSSLSRWGYPEAEQRLTVVNGAFAEGGDFEMVVSGDLRGKWITATGTKATGLIFARRGGISSEAARERYSSYDTSELSNAVRVE